jgi:hypothetical protein
MPTHQPIAGVAPAELGEVTAMVVWPSMAALRLGPLPIGQLLGQLYTIRAGFREPLFNVPFRVGWFLAIVTAPLTVPLYFLMRLPRFPLVFIGFTNPWCWHYRLTNRRLVVEHPFGGGEIKSIALDRFDSIQIETQWGQDWYHAGDLVFYRATAETFRIEGVPRPDTFRHTLLKARTSFVGVQKARAAGLAV